MGTKLIRSSLVIEEFRDKDAGLYTCIAERGKQLYDRRVHISPVGKSTYPKCTPEQNACLPGVECAIIGGKPTCFCPFGFTGEQCLENVVKDYYLKDTVYVGMVGGSAGVTALVSVIIIFGFLFLREKRKTQRFLTVFGPLPSADFQLNAYGEPMFENPYKKISVDTYRETKREDSLRNAFRIPKIQREINIDSPVAPLVDMSKLPSIS